MTHDIDPKRYFKARLIISEVDANGQDVVGSTLTGIQ